MHRLLLTIAILVCCSLTAVAQKNKPLIDSLERVAKVKRDSALVDIYSELAWQNRTVSRPKAIDYSRKAINLSKMTGYQKGLAQAYNDMGIIYYDMERYDSSIMLYQQSLKIRERLRDKLGMAKVYNKIGIVYQRQGKYGDALDNQLKALPIFEQYNQNGNVSASLNNIGILYSNMRLYDEAIKYHMLAVDIREKMNDRLGLMQSYNNLANCYKIQSEHDLALPYYEKALDIARTTDNKEYLSNILNNLGELYVRKKQYPAALAHISESYELRAELNDKKGMISSLTNLGTAYMETQAYDSATAMLSKAISIAQTTDGALPELMQLYQTSSKLFESRKEVTNALDYYKQYIAVKDSIYTSDLNNNFAELQTRYNALENEKLIQQQQSEINRRLYELSQQNLKLSMSDLVIAANKLRINQQNESILSQRLDASHKQRQIQGLNEQSRIQKLEIANRTLEVNRKNLLLGIIAVLVLMSSLLAYSFYRRTKIKQEARLQAELLKQQEMATLAILEAEENERKRVAGELHDGVGQMMSAAKMNMSSMELEIPFANDEQREVYKKMLHLLDESCREVRAVSHSMMPNALLKSGFAAAVRSFLDHIDSRVIKINLYSEGLNERLDNDNVESVLYRVIQECVNNVIKHSGANHLDISLIRDEDGISATIEDNGKGFDTSKSRNFEGIGLKNIISRVNYLKGTVEWQSAPGKGTVVMVHVPV